VGSPPLQLQQQAPAQAALPPAPQSSTTGGARALVVDSVTVEPQPMEVEAPPGPAPTEAPPLLVPPSALPSLGLGQLVAELKGMLAAATLNEDLVGRLLDMLEGLECSWQEMLDSCVYHGNPGAGGVGNPRGLTMNVGPGTRDGLVRPDPGPTPGRPAAV